MAAEKKSVRIASVRTDVLPRPGEGSGQILRWSRMAHIRRQSVIQQDRTNTLLGQKSPQVGMPCLIAGNPRSPVGEDDHRKRARVGQVQIQLMPISSVAPI